MKLTKISLAVLALLLTGCSPAEQVYEKNYVRAASVDKNSAVLTFYDEEGKIFRAYGDDLDEIRENAELGLGRTLFTGHTELLILNECDYENVLKFMLDEWRVSPSCLIAVGDSELLEQLDTENLADSIECAVEQGIVPECDIVTVLGELLGKEGTAEVAALGEKGVSGTFTLT